MRTLVLPIAFVVGLSACGDSAAPTATPTPTPSTEPEPEPHGAEGGEPSAPAPSAGTLGVTPAAESVPPSPWVALELRFTEGERSRDSWSRETLVRLERGVLRVRTHAELHRHPEPDLDASVVLDDATLTALSAAMRDSALLTDVVDVAEPESFHYEELAAVLERDGVRTTVLVQNPTTDLGLAALAAFENVLALVRTASAPPAPPP